MKVFIKHTLLLICSLSCLLPMSIVYAATLSLSVVGDKIVFNNALNISGSNYALTDWEVVGQLTPTNEWQPSLMASTNEFKISGPGGELTVPIKVKGMQYNLGGNTGVTLNATPLVSGTPCSSSSTLNGAVVSLFASGFNGASPNSCDANFSIKTLKKYNPFYFMRPVFEIDEATLIKRLNGLSTVVGGNYVGSITLSSKYYFIENNILTYRLMPARTLSISLDYEPEVLTDIKVDTFKEITPVYNTTAHTVSGSTSFQIDATGYFVNGIKMVFIDKDYSMKHIFDESNPDDIKYGTDKIPYSIRCETCKTKQIVSEGSLDDSVKNNNNSVENRVASPVKNITFSIDVGYSDIKAETVSTGLYRDTITILFKEIL